MEPRPVVGSHAQPVWNAQDEHAEIPREWRAMFLGGAPMNQDELEAELHRKREAKRLLQLFQAENGREPRDAAGQHRRKVGD